MRIACWSGPRNISTALMRSWSSRNDTFVSDEPFYGYYLKETGLNHPMKREIINSCSTDYHQIINTISSKIPNNKTIWYQKHMSHHIIDIKSLSWIKNFKNCILIRNPRDVINSYIKKNTLKDVSDLGYPQQLSILQFLQKKKMSFFIIDSDDLVDNPKKELSAWCNYLNIAFDPAMLSWAKGTHKNDGIWGKHWYHNINNSETFFKKKKVQSDHYKAFESIYNDAVYYYKKIYNLKS
tara:strand:+ start:824 stop:1537 length:714 start_codon:yes stop_codon:yes gene_type:complete